MIIPILEGLTLTKGHAGGRDAIIFPDLDGRRDVSGEHAALICNRRTGIGADALMRVVDANGSWRIDAWDDAGQGLADPGSLVRLAAHYLHVSGLVTLEDGMTLEFTTGAGDRQVTRIGAGYASALDAPGAASEEGIERGFDVAVTLDGVEGMRGGLTIVSERTSIVVALSHDDELSSATGGVQYDPVPASEVLVLVYPEGDTMITDFDGVERPITSFKVRSFTAGIEHVSDELAIRDAAAALHTWAGDGATGIYHADNLGHRTEVRLTGGEVEITGPAEIVAEFQLAGIIGEGR